MTLDFNNNSVLSSSMDFGFYDTKPLDELYPLPARLSVTTTGNNQNNSPMEENEPKTPEFVFPNINPYEPESSTLGGAGFNLFGLLPDNSNDFTTGLNDHTFHLLSPLPPSSYPSDNDNSSQQHAQDLSPHSPQPLHQEIPANTSSPQLMNIDSQGSHILVNKAISKPEHVSNEPNPVSKKRRKDVIKENQEPRQFFGMIDPETPNYLEPHEPNCYSRNIPNLTSRPLGRSKKKLSDEKEVCLMDLTEMENDSKPYQNTRNSKQVLGKRSYDSMEETPVHVNRLIRTPQIYYFLPEDYQYIKDIPPGTMSYPEM